MRASLLIILFTAIFHCSSSAQEFTWKTRIFSYFDNSEFGKSEYRIPQTMSGIQIDPEAGLKWDTAHAALAGFNLIHEFGSNIQIDRIYITAYYKYSRDQFLFLMGAFPRFNTLEKYPRIFFQDSILYYRPNLNGIFWEIHSGSNYFHVWLDWTGRQSDSMRETFFLGSSGRISSGLFYFQHFNYMFHFAGTMNPALDNNLHDNGMLLTSAGIDLSEKTPFDILDINAGWITGIERGRGENTGWIFNNGLLAEARLEHKYFGILNSLYLGEGQMVFYNDHSNDLYWGDPLYRAGNYNRSDFYIKFINKEFVNVRLAYSLHCAEHKMFHEQSLKVSFNLNNY